MLNLTVPEQSNAPSNYIFVKGDACDLKYKNCEFEMVFSNSTIEHVSTFENQRKFAHEVCRVGKNIWIQTPAKEFFYEPHFISPFVHWFPKNVQKKLLRYFSVWGLINKPSNDLISEKVEEIRLLTKAECKELFPNCTIKVERFLFMPKSYIIEKQ